MKQIPEQTAPQNAEQSAAARAEQPAAAPAPASLTGVLASPAVTPAFSERAAPRSERMAATKIECNACPVLCQISVGRSGACDRYANADGVLVRLDPVVLLDRGARGDSEALPFAGRPSEGFGMADAGAGAHAGNEGKAETAGNAGNGDHGDHDSASGDMLFVTGIGGSTTYPEYKPAPFIVSSRADGVDLITAVTEGIFSYCSMKAKIDTDRWLGPEQAPVRVDGEVVGHVTTAEYGSQMLSIGGVHHLTAGSKKEGRVTAEVMQALGNRQAVELSIEGGAELVLQAGKPPVVNGGEEKLMRVGCGAAVIGMFAQQFAGQVDEVIVVDDHITGVLTAHQAGRCLNLRPTGVRIKGKKSTPGRYFKVANPGPGWGGTDLSDPLSVIESWDPALAWPGLRLLMVSTTGDRAEWFELDAQLCPRPAPMPDTVRQIVKRIEENCEPSLATILFVGGAGGSLRSGITHDPRLLTNAIKSALVKVTCGGAPAYIWPGGGITLMVDVSRMPANSFGTVPTPAIVAPIEFSMRVDDYRALGGHMEYVRSLDEILRTGAWHSDGAPTAYRRLPSDPVNPWPLMSH